jgi:uncharacterized protein YjbI with pentapeptide repeats
VANPEHLDILRQGVDIWNEWRKNELKVRPDLGGADLRKANLNLTDLHGAMLGGADLYEASLIGANLRKANLHRTILKKADLGAADLYKANLSEANLAGADLGAVNLGGANLSGAELNGVNLFQANLRKANLDGAFLSGADLYEANLSEATLVGAHLTTALLIKTNLANADLTGCRVHGISAWNVKLSEGTKQQNLLITDHNEPDVTVDNIEVAQFVYLLLHNEKIRHVIDTLGKKGVLLLGRFTEGRMAVLDRLRDELRKRGYLPIVFNFDKPETKDFTETVRLLAGLSKFVIADITNPKSAPLELQATVPEIMVPFRPIIEEGEKPFAILQDLWIKHRNWVFEPIYYSSVDALIASLDEKIKVPVTINGQLTLKFVVDSGAADVSIPADVVGTLVRTETITDADFLGKQIYQMADGSTVPSMRFVIRSLKVGDKTLENVTGSIAPVAGSLLLGQSFLSHFKSWSMDNQGRTLILN